MPSAADRHHAGLQAAQATENQASLLKRFVAALHMRITIISMPEAAAMGPPLLDHVWQPILEVAALDLNSVRLLTLGHPQPAAAPLPAIAEEDDVHDTEVPSKVRPSFQSQVLQLCSYHTQTRHVQTTDGTVQQSQGAHRWHQRMATNK